VAPRWRRPVLLAVTLGACSPLAGSNWGSWNSPGSSGAGGTSYGSCGAGPGAGAKFALDPTLANGFSYICPSSEDGGAALADAAPNGDGLPAFESDPYCAMFVQSAAATSAEQRLLLELLSVPAVAAGAPFHMVYDAESADGGPPPVTTVAAAVPADLQITPAGFVIPQPGYLALLAWQGSEVAAFTHVLARQPVALGIAAGFPVVRGPDASAALPLVLDAGSLASVVAYPEADDGTLLAGQSPPCTFESSAPQLLSVQGQGVVALLTPRAGGSATLAAQCGGLSGSIAVQIAGSLPVDEYDAFDGSDEPTDDASADAGTVPEAGPTDASPALDGNQGDAP
jgi:hypothetical protein